jgi:quercetin dioxygenase-like cupin family protein
VSVASEREVRTVESWDVGSMDLEPQRPKVLRSDAEARVIAIALSAGQALADHQVHERAWLVVAEGEVEVQEGDDTQSGGPGFLAHFQANERHEVRATTDARMLLILAPGPGQGHPSHRPGGGGA